MPGQEAPGPSDDMRPTWTHPRMPRLGVALTALLLAAACAQSPRARQHEVRRELETLDRAVTEYAVAHNAHPGTLHDLVADARTAERYGLTQDWLRDPYGRPYAYTPANGASPYDIVSYGRDGAPGGEGEDADVGLSSLHVRR